MPEHLFMARAFLAGGGALALLGFILWFALPIPSTFPPFLPTALLALGYGVACLKESRSQGGGKS